MEQFAETIKIANKVGVTFCYSIGSGVSINYASEEDVQTIKDKFRSFYDCGARTFSILLDDIAAEFCYEEERQKYKSYAEAHIAVCNELFEWLQSLDSSTELIMCPTDYKGTAPFSSYIHELGEELHPEIDIFYTGPYTCTPTIPASDTQAFAKAIQRPPVIWDNYPVNDLAMQSEMHIGPITGRDASLYKECKGFVVNTMIQAEASKIPLMTFSDYFESPEDYDPWKSWEKALRTVGGNENYHALIRFAENSLHSCLNQAEGQPLKDLAKKTLSSIQNDEEVSGSQAVKKLQSYLDELDEAGYHLKNRMGNYALRNNLVPWIELLEHWVWASRRAIAVLEAMESHEDYSKPLRWLRESFEEIEHHPKHIAGKELLPLLQYALKEADKAKRPVV
jgi:hyaluronoglucosaminidase